jgi:hypothetical protein
MADGGFTLEELTYGQLNNLQENDSNASGDRRRTDPVTALRIATEKAFARDTLQGISEFYGIVVGRRVITTAVYDYRPTVLNTFPTIQQEGDAADPEPKLQDADINQYLYKVYIPELQPLCPPASFDDPIILNYPDVGVDLPLAGKADIAVGKFVTVRYEDPGNLFGPKIVKVSDEVLKITNVTSNISGKTQFQGGRPTTIEVSTPREQENVIPPEAQAAQDRLIGGPRAEFIDNPASNRLRNAINIVATRANVWLRCNSAYRDGYNQARVMHQNVFANNKGIEWLDQYGPRSKEVKEIFNSTGASREEKIKQASKISWIANNRHATGALDIQFKVYDSKAKAKAGSTRDTAPSQELIKILLTVQEATQVAIHVEGDHFHLDPNKAPGPDDPTYNTKGKKFEKYIDEAKKSLAQDKNLIINDRDALIAQYTAASGWKKVALEAMLRRLGIDPSALTRTVDDVDDDEAESTPGYASQPTGP